MKVTKQKINSIKKNPKNPRILRDEKFDKLCKSISEFPEMLEIRPIVVDENNMVLGGNMRLAACKHLGINEVYTLQASDLTDKQKREFIIKDNVSFGDWDFDTLANDWDTDELESWGLTVSLGEDLDMSDIEDDDDKTNSNDEKVQNITCPHCLTEFSI